MLLAALALVDQFADPLRQYVYHVHVHAVKLQCVEHVCTHAGTCVNVCGLCGSRNVGSLNWTALLMATSIYLRM